MKSPAFAGFFITPAKETMWSHLLIHKAGTRMTQIKGSCTEFVKV
jgi:hypothetical protein